MTALSNIEAEQIVLGSLLMENDLLDLIDGVVSAGDFSEGLHQKIFDHARKVISEGGTASPVTMDTFFRDDLDRAGVTDDYLANLAGGSMPLRAAAEHARLVHALGVRRRIAELAREAADQAEHGDISATPEQMVEALQKRLDGLFAGGGDRAARTMGSASASVLEAVARAYEQDGQITGLATGLTELDEKLGGLHPGNLIVMAGATGMGKTALAVTIALNAGFGGKRVLVNSHEMIAEELAERALSARTGLSVSAMRKGSIDEADYRALTGAAQDLNDLALHVDDSSGLTVFDIATRARRHKRQHGLDLLIIDYIQLVRAEDRRLSRTHQIEQITNTLKALAQELKIPVIALSQLSRGVDNRPDNRPVLSDLRDSGSIEQDANVVVFVYRRHYYMQRETPPADNDEKLKWLGRFDACKGKADLIIAKQRHGPTGSVTVAFDETTTTFRDLGESE